MRSVPSRRSESSTASEDPALRVPALAGVRAHRPEDFVATTTSSRRPFERPADDLLVSRAE